MDTHPAFAQMYWNYANHYLNLVALTCVSWWRALAPRPSDDMNDYIQRRVTLPLSGLQCARVARCWWSTYKNCDLQLRDRWRGHLHGCSFRQRPERKQYFGPRGTTKYSKYVDGEVVCGGRADLCQHVELLLQSLNTNRAQLFQTHSLGGCGLVSDEQLADLCTLAPHISSLTLTCNKITVDGMLTALAHCSALTCVDLSWATPASGVLTAVTEMDVAQLSIRCPIMESMSLRGCSFNGTFAHYLPLGLTVLDLSMCTIDDAAVQAIADHCSQLVTLTLVQREPTFSLVCELCALCDD